MKASTTTPGRHLAEMPAGSFVHVDELPGSRGAASSATSRAHKHGELVAVRKGLYWKGKSTRYGMTRPSTEAIAVEVLGTTGVGPTGHSAARALGLTSQVPAQPALTIAGPVPTSVPGVRISRRNNMARRDLRYAEIALVELLRGDWESVVEGGWDALASATARVVTDRTVRLAAVATAVEGERSPAARTNLARLTDALAHSASIAGRARVAARATL